MSEITNSLSPSLIRTAVPFLFGGLLTRYGVDPNDPTAAVLLTGGIGYVFYAVVRALEVFAGPKWGYVLGVAKAPAYAAGPPPQDPPPPAGPADPMPMDDHYEGDHL